MMKGLCTSVDFWFSLTGVIVSGVFLFAIISG